MGIRKARQKNICLLRKHARAFMNDPGKLWVCILSDKYLCNSSIFQATQHPRSSILQAFDMLKNGFSFRIGHGDFSLWFKYWFEGKKLCDMVLYVHTMDNQLRLCDVFHNGSWNWKRKTLAIDIPNEVRQKTQHIFVFMKISRRPTFGVPFGCIYDKICF